MTENKFTVGSQWLTKGGWRAVVVDELEYGYFRVWHENDFKTIRHDKDEARGDGYDLMEPYKELRKGTVWVNVYLDKTDNQIVSVSYTSEENLNSERLDFEEIDYELIASFKHDWTENEKL